MPDFWATRSFAYWMCRGFALKLPQMGSWLRRSRSSVTFSRMRGTIAASLRYPVNSLPAAGLYMQIRYGFDIELTLFQPTTIVTVMDVHPSRRRDVIKESEFFASQSLPVETFIDRFGNLSRRVTAEAGPLGLRLEGVVHDTGRHDEVNRSADAVPLAEMPPDVLPFLTATRYCETDLLSNFAWSRFCMSDNLGNWVGELLHQTNLCDLPDLFDWAGDYPSGANMGPFDQEAGYEATHISAWTKRGVGWVDPSTVAQHAGLTADYTLHSASLIQPPPTGRVAAIQIGAKVPYLMVEARLKADQFDINIPNEGVIVYEVQTTDPLGNAQNSLPALGLLTKTALTVGQSFTTITGVTVQVSSSVSGGFSVTVFTTPNPVPSSPSPDMSYLVPILR